MLLSKRVQANFLLTLTSVIGELKRPALAALYEKPVSYLDKCLELRLISCIVTEGKVLHRKT
jgi:hypothetical protein